MSIKRGDEVKFRVDMKKGKHSGVGIEVLEKGTIKVKEDDIDMNKVSDE